MTIAWTYKLAPDVHIQEDDGGMLVRAGVQKALFSTSAEIAVLGLLTSEDGVSETLLRNRIAALGQADNADILAPALLFKLESMGVLGRTLFEAGEPCVSISPLRAPRNSMRTEPPSGQLRLSPYVVAEPKEGQFVIQVPGAWASFGFHDRGLLGLLHDLTVGGTAEDIFASASRHSEELLAAVLAAMQWCGLLDQSSLQRWSGHALNFHTRTRSGYRRSVLGRRLTPTKGDRCGATFPPRDAAKRIVLMRPDVERLRVTDPPFALVAERRRSIRHFAAEPIGLAALSEFLFRTLHGNSGRRPYPSGGALYPLTGYLLVHRCLKVESGLYAYEPIRHELEMVAEIDPRLNRLLSDAAACAGVVELPQVLVLLAARFAVTENRYGDLAYSLILKEVGTVFQAAMMAAAVMGIGVCPLGVGDSPLFSRVAGFDPLTETSVGEIMIGSM